MSDDFERDRLAGELRASLARHAADAPAGASADTLAERIISAADQNAAGTRETQRRGWRGWALPAIAAAAVAAVVVTVVGIENYHPNATPPVATRTGSMLRSPLPSTAISTPSSIRSTRPVNATDLTNVKILDLTFAYGYGWALATADCTDGSGGTCTALLHTTDGVSWTSMPGPEFNVRGVKQGCSTKCVSHIRFADKTVGYVFGPSAFFVTTDGGRTWQQQTGGALALETLDRNVIRVYAAQPSGCPGPCDVRVETSSVGSTKWTPASLGGGSVNVASPPQLARGAGQYAYLLLPGNPASGASNETSTLYHSTDNGQNWSNAGEPCWQPQSGLEADSYAVAAGDQGRVSVLCATRQAPQRWFVATSTDGGASFKRRPGTIPAPVTSAGSTLLTGDSATELVVAGNGLALSTDAGKTWKTVADVPGTVTFVGFESQTDGRAVTDGVIWTTTDGGKTWTPAPFR